MAPRVLAGSGAGASAAAEFARRSRARWWRLPVFRLLEVVAVGAAVFAAFAVRGAGPGAAVLGAAVAGGAGWAAARVRPETDPERWRRGADGERTTAALLQALPRRFVVGHDLAVPGSAANIDHVVIGPTGIFVIDTKAYRGRLGVRRRRLWAGRREVDAGPAAWEAALVSEVAGVPVRAVLAVHGSGLRRRGVDDNGVWIVPAARVATVVARGRRSGWSRPQAGTRLGRTAIEAIAGEIAATFS
jgi:hypothetical protein